jgi:uncharacterized membrane protein
MTRYLRIKGQQNTEAIMKALHLGLHRVKGEGALKLIIFLYEIKNKQKSLILSLYVFFLFILYFFL